MLDLEVSPEEGLQHDHWEFLLGMHFSQAVGIVQSQVRVIKSAHVIYNDQNPLSHDLILDLPGDGFRLIFDSKSQRLKLIEIYNLKLIRLKYSGTVFNGTEVVPTVSQIDRTFGATRPGTFDKERGLFALNFRGLSFYFPVDSQFQPHYTHGLGSLKFPGEATPILNRVVIYHGNNPNEGPTPPLPPSCFRGNVYCDECIVLRNPTRGRTLGLSLKLFAQTTDALEVDGQVVRFERNLEFGESAQSVAAKLGTPTKVYYKSDDKMKIHSKEAHRKTDKSDYFFNYFTIGIDVLFDACTNRVTKFILHTNFPGHYDFTDYHRSPFTLTLGRSSTSHSLPSSITTPTTTPPEELLESTHITPPSQGGGQGGGKNKNKKKGGNGGGNGNNNGGGGGKNKQQMPIAILPLATSSEKTSPSQCLLQGTSETELEIKWETRWEEIRNFLWIGERRGQPVVLTRNANPFGPSLCYGVQDMIFEVMSNDHLATVSLYNVPDDNDHHNKATF